VLLAEQYGVPRKKAVEVMLNSAIASPALKYRGPFVADMPDEAWFDVDMMQKDLRLALDLAGELGVPLPTTRITDDLLSATRDLGLADQDFAIMYRALEHQAGLGN
jgi:3-hydroxyisobutyrate dehydrogenase-like beta-hydroxyacid dehydrogenase